MGNTEPELKVKSYEFSFKGHTIPLDEEDYLKVRNLFIQDYVDKNNTKPFEFKDDKWTAEKPPNKISLSVSSKPKVVPPGFIYAGKRNTQPRNGSGEHFFVYYKDDNGNFGFIAENQKHHSFTNLGRIDNPNSVVGRFYTFLKSIPKNTPVKRQDVQKVILNSTYQKAIFDIFDIEKLLTTALLPEDRRKGIEYYKTEKFEGLRVDNNHGFPQEVQVSPSPQQQVAKPG